MGKYAATRAMQRDRQHNENSLSSVGSYLYDVPTDRDQFMVQSFAYSLDPTGIYRSALDTRDRMNYWTDYFKNTGLSWSDVKYPTLMMGFGNVTYANSLRNAITFSKNIVRLYR